MLKNMNILQKFNLSLLIIVIIFVFKGFPGTYWVSPTGASSWANCLGSTPLSGDKACSLKTANINAKAGDVIYLRGGTYNYYIYPSNSGMNGSVIVYKAYPGEMPTISGHNQYGTMIGIWLTRVNYIKVDGIRVNDCDRMLLISNGASYNEIVNCVLENTTIDGIKIYQGTSLTPWNPFCTNNLIHHCTIRNMGSVGVTKDEQGNITSCNDWGGLIQIGVPSYDSGSGNNTLEDNIWYNGGHHLIETYTKYNVIRNNVMYNYGWMKSPGSGCPYKPDSSGLYGNRNLQIYDGYGRDGTYNLVEGNRLGHAGQPPDDDGGSSMELTAPKNIIRYNSFFNSINDGIYFKAGYLSIGTNNRVYNNTIFHNGTEFTSGLQSRSGMRFRSDAPDNVIKNNIIYDNYNGDFKCTGTGCSLSLQSISNNWLHGSGDPIFVNPDLTVKDSTTLPDLNLQSNSPAIDKGTHLTQAKGSGESSTLLMVDDAMPFQDGTWGSSLAGLVADWISVGTIDNIMQIKAINYETNTITLVSPLTWSDRARIWLFKKSDGRRVLYGGAPDIGAFEFIPKILNEPGNLRIIQ